MKNILLLFSVLVMFGCANDSNKSNKINMTDSPAIDTTDILRHVVLFKFKETSTEDEIQRIEKSFLNLTNKIKEIKDIEWGLNNSPEGLNKDFTHCFLVTFDSEENRSIYLPHPAHQEFVTLIGPHVDDVLVFDYWSK